MNDEDLERRLRALRPAGAPAGLRQRVLAGARERLRRPAQPDIWTRLWESRPLRAAWAAALVLLVAAHAAVTPRPRAGMARAADEADRELGRLVRLPEIDSQALPDRDRARPKENRS